MGLGASMLHPLVNFEIDEIFWKQEMIDSITSMQTFFVVVGARGWRREVACGILEAIYEYIYIYINIYIYIYIFTIPKRMRRKI